MPKRVSVPRCVKVGPMSKWTACVAFVASCGAHCVRERKIERRRRRRSASAVASAATESAAMKCGAEAPVWALQSPKVYFVPSDRLYGKTKGGHYLCRSDAHAEGFRPARRPLSVPPQE